ncbi:Uma2 family endonuclease [Desulfobacterales bacterium HSG2]|nr:Uma2 family endonuclease [Desulfobacterales bacterium HSG2]
MNTALKIPANAGLADPPALKITETVRRADRPGWIPADIIYDWDTCPYAYQTEEKLMPAGGLHGQLLAYIMEILRIPLENRERMFLMDTFMLYRNRKGIKHRIAPDLLLMPFRFPPPSAYDLDREPPPLAVVEVTSPKSHLKDRKVNIPFYTGLGVPTYLVIDAVTPRAQLRNPFVLHLWRKTGRRVRKIRPDAEGRLLLPEMKISVRAEGQRLIFADSVTGEILRDTGQLYIENEQLKTAAETAEKKAVKEHRRAETAEKKAVKEHRRAETAEKKAVKEHRRAETAEKKAVKEHRRAETAEKKAVKEHRRAERAEKEAERLAELLKSAGIDPGLPKT